MQLRDHLPLLIDQQDFLGAEHCGDLPGFLCLPGDGHWRRTEEMGRQQHGHRRQ
jgi:hypothetical protein